MRYELIYLIGASEEANIEQIKKDVEKIITDFSGVFEEKEWTEKRRLAYQIGKDFQGTYFAKRFNLEEKERLAEINKQLRLLSNILRFMIIKTDDLPELDELEKREEKESAKEKVERKEESLPVTKKEQSQPEVKKPIEQKPSEKKSKEKPSGDSEDIDKKLEEILNI